MMDWIVAFFMAWGMFWIVPCPLKRWDSDGYERMLLCFPWIGCLAGALWSLAAVGRDAWLPGMFGAVIMAVLPHLLTGFIHVDGFMDCADAVCSRREREERLRILKDPHVGTFAVVFLVILLLTEFALFAENTLAGREWGLLFVMAVPRAVTALCVLSMKPLEHSGYARMFGAGVKTGHRFAAGAELLLLVVLPILLWQGRGLFALAGCAGAFAAVLALRRNLGGMSGDVSGAGVVVGELIGLMALVWM